MAQSFVMIFIDFPDGCCYRDQNTWNIFPVSQQKITLNNQTTNNQMKQSEQNSNRIKSNRAESSECKYETTGKMTNNN
jgi:hypothetical protein